MTLLLALFLALAPQDTDYEKKIGDLSRGLTADELDERDRAFDEIVGLGPKALEALKKKADAAEGDLKARLLGAVKEIERRERMKEYLGGVTKVSLKAEKMPLKEVVAELKNQAKTKVIVLGSLKEEEITIEFKDVPFFEALEKICRSHGGVTFRLQGGQFGPSSGEETVSIVKGTPGRVPRFLQEQFVIDLATVTLVEESDFQGAAKEEMRLEFRTLWERGTKPIGAKLKVTSLVDDKGTAYTDALQQNEQAGGNWQWVPLSHQVSCQKIPPKDVTAFKEVAGFFEVEFPGDIEVLKVDAPLGKTDVAVRGESFAYTMVSCVRDGKTVKAKIAAAPDADIWRREFKLVDKNGKEFSSHATSSTSDGKSITMELQFSNVPAEAEITTFKLTQPKPGGTKKIEFRFENVKIR